MCEVGLFLLKYLPISQGNRKGYLVAFLQPYPQLDANSENSCPIYTTFL